jgi:hypothetical protein
MTAMSFRSNRHYALTQFQRLCLPRDNKAIYEFRRRHHPIRPDDGAVSSKIGRTINGVVTIAIRNVPKKPIRRSIPSSPVSTQKIT